MSDTHLQDVVRRIREASPVGPGKIGRPPVGRQVVVRMPEPMIERLDELAREAGVSRPEIVRRLLAERLG